MNPIQLGNLRFERPLFMGPMEGITDAPFRKIVRKHGCAVTCTQMIHAEAMLLAPPEKMRHVTAIDPAEHPVGIQFCTPDPGHLAEASKRAEQAGFAFIDINMGCPVPNVVKRGAGAALLKDPSRAAELVRAAVAAVRIPVTVKIRSGWDEAYRSGPEVARLAAQEGAGLVTVHARTRSQGHAGKVDWALLAQIKASTPVPVVGNGGVLHAGDIERMLDETKVDGVMVARGALGNPWIFSGRRPSAIEIRDTLLAHLEYHLAFYEDRDRALLTFRKHIVWYTKGLRDAAGFRRRLFSEKSYEGMITALTRFFDGLDPSESPSSR
ncbi:MAG: tRNA dihydrouridine synthase DusB [Pseudomonadota bacterium]